MSKIYYPLYGDGTLDPKAESILKQISESNSEPISELTPQKARECFLEESWLCKPDQSIKIEKIRIGFDNQIPAHIYTPEGKQPCPILIFFHGGGFVLGSLNEFDAFCTKIAQNAKCLVVSVGYRLAPENKYPAAVEDATEAVEWISKNAEVVQGDSSRIAIAGDSAGANLAAVCTIVARGRGFPKIRYQILICPWVDLSSWDTASYRYFGGGSWLSTTNIHWYRNHYLQNSEQALSPLVSPLLTEDFSELPPALVITAEFDVLKDEGEAYAKLLEKEGIQVQYSQYEGMLHDFPTLPGVFDQAHDAIDEMCIALQRAFNK